MPTYLYFCPTHQEFEAIHSIIEELTECPHCKAESKQSAPPKRLIAASSFILVGDGWAKDNYSTSKR